MSIKSSIKEPIPKYWMVEINEPGKTHTSTRNIGVVAMDLITALNAVKQQRPEAIIVSANHWGPVNILALDDELKKYLNGNDLTAEKVKKEK